MQATVLVTRHPAGASLHTRAAPVWVSNLELESEKQDGCITGN